MKRIVLLSYLFSQVLVRRFIPSCIVLALFLAPLEFPFTQLAEEQSFFPIHQNPTAKEAYTIKATETATKATGHTITYTRSAQSVVSTVSSTPEEKPRVDIVDIVSTSSTEILTPTEVSPIMRRSGQSARALENHRAAAAVAEGNTSSELAAVTIDEGGNIVATVDFHGNEKTAAYNEAGQPIKITEADGTTTYYQYDTQGRLLGISHDERVAYAPGLRGLSQRLIAPLRALANSSDDTSFDYEGDSITEAENSTAGGITYEYDEDGLVTLESRPDGSQIEYEYDELGNVTSAIEVPVGSHTPGLGSWLRLSYATSLLTTTVQERTTYDDNSRVRSYEIALVSDSSETVSADNTGMSTTTDSVPYTGTTTVSTTTFTTETASTSTDIFLTDSVEYSTATQIVETVSSTTTDTSAPVPVDETIIDTITESISSLFGNSITTVALWFDGILARTFADDGTSEQPATSTATTTATLYRVVFTYDAQGNVTESLTSTGIKTTYQYDSLTDSLIATEVTTKEGETMRDYRSVDSTARITSQNGTAYTYREDGVLTSHDNEVYTYDENGNRTRSSASTYTYAGNRLTSVTSADGRVVTYAYDERGAVTTITDSVAGDTTFTYTLAGAIESINRNGDTISYAYDALNRRVTRTDSTGTVYYSYNGSALKRVSDHNNQTLREYFYTPTGQLTAINAQDTWYHAITSANKSIIGLVDTTSNTIYTATYDTWGAVLHNNFPVALDIGYIGGFVEPALGYSILGPRVYDPTIGRFLAKDPLPGLQVDRLSQNEYIYAKNDPVNQYDPTGHASELAMSSASPKRSLVDTNAAITTLESDLADAKATLSITDSADSAAYTLAMIDVSNIESALADLYTIKRETEATIANNEAEARIPTPPTTLQAVEVPVTVWDITTSSSLVPQNSSASTTTATDTVSEASVEDTATTTTSAVPPATTETESTTIPAPIQQPDTTQNQESTIVVPTTEQTTPAVADEITVSISKGILLVASAVFGDHVLKAEAKKKSKAKKAKKSKKSVSNKAKSKQASKVEKVSSLKKQLSSLQKKLSAVQNKNARSRVTKRELARLQEETARVAVDVLTLRVAQLTAERNDATRLATERSKAQALATATQNLTNSAKEQVKAVAVAPTAPTAGVWQGPVQSAGVPTPRLTFEQPTAWWLTATSVAVSLVPVVGEVYDGWTLYAQRDPITGEPLTLIGNAFTIIGLGTIAGSGKVAREVGERAIRQIATSKGIDYDLVNSAAEEVIKETDLVKLAAGGKAGFDELLTKISERAVAKNIANLTAIATKIANGHAYTDHIHEFKHLGITSQSQFKEHVVKVLTNPSDSHTGKNGKKYFWDDVSKTFAVIDELNPDMGTAFIPARGKQYYLDQLVK